MSGVWNDEWRAVRREVLERDGYGCRACPRTADPEDIPEWLHAHHVRAREDGGPDEPENCLTLCVQCHQDKHTGRVSYLSAEFVQTVRGYGPLTTGEVAEWMGCSRTTARRRLTELETDGHVARENGEGGAVWTAGTDSRSLGTRILAALWPFG